MRKGEPIIVTIRKREPIMVTILPEFRVFLKIKIEGEVWGFFVRIIIVLFCILIILKLPVLD